jgi:hypothetical protein
MQRRLGELFTALFIEEKGFNAIELNKTYLYFIHLQLISYSSSKEQNTERRQKCTGNTENRKANRTHLCKLSCRAGFCKGLGSGSILGGKLLAMSAPLQTSGKLIPSASREICKKAAD